MCLWTFFLCIEEKEAAGLIHCLSSFLIHAKLFIMRFMQQVKNVISMKNQLLLPDSFSTRTLQVQADDQEGSRDDEQIMIGAPKRIFVRG
jgi:hypothetical protein